MVGSFNNTEGTGQDSLRSSCSCETGQIIPCIESRWVYLFIEKWEFKSHMSLNGIAKESGYQGGSGVEGHGVSGAAST